jgi:hypothetical protein
MYIGSSCTNSTDKSTEKTNSADTAKPVYAYSVKNPDNWDIGSSKKYRSGIECLESI